MKVVFLALLGASGALIHNKFHFQDLFVENYVGNGNTREKQLVLNILS
jgi:hypothetical protein